MSTLGGTGETVFLERPGVRVTNARFIVGAQTYAMSAVGSVTFVEGKREVGFPLGVLIVGALITFVGLVTAGADGLGEGVPAIFVGLVVLGFGVPLYRRAKATHSVVLRTTAGEVRALESSDEDEIRTVVRALNDALVARG